MDPNDKNSISKVYFHMDLGVLSPSSLGLVTYVNVQDTVM